MTLANPHLKVGVVNYWSNYVPAADLPRILEWQRQHTDVLIGGKYPGNGPVWTGYEDSCSVYHDDRNYRALQTYCEDRGIDFENAFIHMRENFTARAAWTLPEPEWQCHDGVHNCNGWTEDSPTPEASAVARMYSRACGYGSPNRPFVNPAQRHDGISPFAAIKAATIVGSDSHLTGMYLDNVGVHITAGVQDPSDPLAKSDFSSESWADSCAEVVAQITQEVKLRRPDMLIVHGNPQQPLVAAADMLLWEYAAPPYAGGAMWVSGEVAMGSKAGYDWFLPDTNPTGSKGLFQHQDILDIVSGGYAWDRSNRGPMMALASYYICQNENTLFHYYSHGGYAYKDTCDVVLKDGSKVLLCDATPQCADVKRWGNYFPAMFVDIGVASAARYKWPAGQGSGYSGTWRRDYAGGIVLCRVKVNATGTQFDEAETYDLGKSYRRLRADGTFEEPSNTVSLRWQEGAILVPYNDMPLNPNIKIANVSYWTSYVTTEVREQFFEWAKNRCDLHIGGNKPLAGIWVGYHTLGGFYSIDKTDPQFRRLKLMCDERGWDREKCLIHMRADYEAKYPWNGSAEKFSMARFGVFEGANGVIVDDVDVTSTAFDGGNFAIQQTMYLGSDAPFDRAYLTYSASEPISCSWQYWNGALWAPLPGVVYGMQGDKVDELLQFVPPVDWSRVSVNGSWEKFFIRLVRRHAVGDLVLKKVRTDDWMSSTAGCNCRGWDSADPNIINHGTEVEYNSTPPPHATAHFRQQARATGYWQPGILYGNQAYEVDGVHPFVEFKVLGGLANIDKLGTDGLMYDSLGAFLETGIVSFLDVDGTINTDKFKAYTQSDLVEYTSQTPKEMYLQTWREYVQLFHELRPGSLLGGNTHSKDFIFACDFASQEYYNPPRSGGALSYNKTRASYDDYLPENNPGGTFGHFMLQDVLDTVSGGYAWDRANRGPMMALASHYIKANENTYLHYFSHGGWAYRDLDEVYLKDGTERRLSDGLPLPPLEEIHHWANFFPAMYVDPGKPLGSGYKMENTSGYSGTYRREYERAIVMVRTKVTPTAEQMEEAQTYELPGYYKPLRADGTFGEPANTVTLRWQEGAILISADTLPPPDDTTTIAEGELLELSEPLGDHTYVVDGTLKVNSAYVGRCKFSGSGSIEFYAPPDTLIERCDFRQCKSIKFSSDIHQTPGSRRCYRCTFDKQDGLTSITFTRAHGWLFDTCVGRNASFRGTLNCGGITYRNGFFTCWDRTDNEPFTFYAHNGTEPCRIIDSHIYYPERGECIYGGGWGEIGRTIIEGEMQLGAANFIGEVQEEVHHCLFIRNLNGVIISHGIVDGAGVVAHHNTHYAPVSHNEYRARLFIDETRPLYNTPIKAHSNLIVGPAKYGVRSVRTPEGIDIDFDFNVYCGILYPYGQPEHSDNNYEVRNASGQHDVSGNIDPQFADPTRSLKTWNQLFGTGTADHVDACNYLMQLNELNLPDEIFGQIRAWLYEGFTPSNPVVLTAGKDGTTAGAVQVGDVPPVVNVDELIAELLSLITQLGEVTMSLNQVIADAAVAAGQLSAVAQQVQQSIQAVQAAAGQQQQASVAAVDQAIAALTALKQQLEA